MAIEFARLRYIKRTDGGNVCRTAAYNARTDVKCLRTGERFFFGHRPGLLRHEIILPKEASEAYLDAATLWNAAQAMEQRKDAQEARELLLALPADPGLTLDDWRAMTHAFVRDNFVSQGLPVQIDIHAPHESEGDGDDRNVHAHLIIAQRRLGAEGFAALKARDLEPEVRHLKDGRRTVTEAERWGALWRDFQNGWFERNGLAVRVDPTGFVSQEHEGPIRFRTNPAGADAIARLVAAQNARLARDPQRVLDAVTRHHATFTALDIDNQLRKPVPDQAERLKLRERILAHDSVVALYERDSAKFTERYTLRSVREQERDVVASATLVHLRRDALPRDGVHDVLLKHGLDLDQGAALLKATGTDGLVLVEGRAGAGKSTSIGAIREAHERAGWRVVGLAPTNAVADDLRRAGLPASSTVHLALFHQENGTAERAAPWDKRTVIVVDEAAMIDTQTYARLMRRVAENGAKLVLVGDDRQLASVERGGMFAVLRDQYGASALTRVRRQSADWQREATGAFAEGRIGEGLRAYANHGFVHWSDTREDSRTRLLSDWDQHGRERPDVARFIYASTNSEVIDLNVAIQRIRRGRGEVGDMLTFNTDRGPLELGPGDRIQFRGNDRRLGLFNGALATVRSIAEAQVTVTIDGGAEVSFDPATFDQFQLGYAGTIYRSQGKTQAEVYALYDNVFAWNARTAYVALSRHTRSVNLYVSRDLARDEQRLAWQMSRTLRDEASLAYAERGEVIKAATDTPAALARDAAPAKDQDAAGVNAGVALTPKSSVSDCPIDEGALRLENLPDYAAERHGFTVVWEDTAQTRARLQRGPDIVRVRLGPGGVWSYFSESDPYDRGDIITFEAWRSTVSHERAVEILWRHVHGGLESAQPQALPTDALKPIGPRPPRMR